MSEKTAKCPVHGFKFVLMPRDPDGVFKSKGYTEKCPLKNCKEGNSDDGKAIHQKKL